MVSDKIIEIDENLEEIGEAIRDRKGFEGYNFFENTFITGKYSGVDLTIDENGIMDFNGISTSANDKKSQSFILEKGTYTLFANEKAQGQLFGNFNIIKASDNSIIKAINLNGTKATFILTERTECKLQFYFPANIEFNHLKIYPMIYEGTEEKPYEPYCKYKISEIPPAIRELPSVPEYNKLMEYIPKSTTEEKSFKAIPLSMKQKINGKVEQTQYEGYNLEDLTSYGTHTMAGVTLTNENGVITLNGTCTASNNFIIVSPKTFEAGDYTFKCSFEGVLPNNASARADVITGTGTNFVIGNKDDKDKIYTSNISSTFTPNYRIRIDNGFTYNNVKLYPMFVKGIYTEATIPQYEPYVGGVPSPSPEYPSEIENVEGYNLLDTTKFVTTTINNVTCTNKGNGTFLVNGLATEDTDFILCQYKPLENVSYFFNGCPSGGSTTTYMLNMNVLGYNEIGNGRSFKETSSTLNNVRIRIKKGTNCNNLLFKPMLIEGTEPKPYTPYGYIREDFVGKNRVDINNQNWKNGYLKNDDGVEQTTTASKYSQNFTEVEPSKQFTLSGVQGAPTNNIRVYFYDKNKTWISRSEGIEIRTLPKVILIPANCYYIQYQLIMNTDESEIQFEEGSTATPYEPYKSTSQLIYIGENELLTDDFVEVDEKGNTKLEKGWGKVVLDGSENGWLIASNDTNTIRFRIDNLIKTTSNSISFSTHFKGYPFSDRTIDKQGIFLSNNEMYIRINKSEVSNLEEFKNKLTEIKPAIFYKLAEPTTINLGQHEPIIPLEGTNNISIEATLEPSKIETEYYYDYRDIQTAMLNAEPEI